MGRGLWKGAAICSVGVWQRNESLKDSAVSIFYLFRQCIKRNHFSNVWQAKNIIRHTGWLKKCHTFLYALTLSNINRFSKLFHCQNQEKICNNTITKDPTTPQVCRYTTLWNVSVLEATTENNTTSVITHSKKSTTGNKCLLQGSRIRSVRILFSERYVRTLTYSILAYVNKNRIR